MSVGQANSPERVEATLAALARLRPARSVLVPLSAERAAVVASVDALLQEKARIVREATEKQAERERRREVRQAERERLERWRASQRKKQAERDEHEPGKQAPSKTRVRRKPVPGGQGRTAPREAQCGQCGQAFIAHFFIQKYCSPQCYKSAKNVQSLARWRRLHPPLPAPPPSTCRCGAIFSPKGRQKHCSPACRYAAKRRRAYVYKLTIEQIERRRQRQRESGRRRRSRATTQGISRQRTCPCGRPFTVDRPSGLAGKRAHKFCSRKCCETSKTYGTMEPAIFPAFCKLRELNSAVRAALARSPK